MTLIINWKTWGDSEDEPVDEELYYKIIPHKKPKLQISINIDIPEKEANSIISYIYNLSMIEILW